MISYFDWFIPGGTPEDLISALEELKKIEGIDEDGVMFAPFTVRMSFGDTSSATAYNNGTIKIKSLI